MTTDPKQQKIGPYSKRDKDFIAFNHNKLRVDEIARELKRNPDTVRETMIKMGYQPIEPHGPIKQQVYDIKRSLHWKSLQEQFSESEQKMFLHHWEKMASQFEDDVLHTEELQMIDYIKLEILMDRLGKDDHKMRMDIVRFEKELLDELALPLTSQDQAKLNNLERQITMLKNAQKDILDSHTKMLSHKEKLLMSMKGTRDARIKLIETGKENISSWMKLLLSQPHVRHKMGIEMEKMRLAAQEEYKRLSEYHTYADGTVDQPILTSDTVVDETLQ